MSQTSRDNRIDRRTFLKVGTFGAAAVAAGRSVTAGSEEPVAPPEGAYRTLGRTGLKVSVIGFGALKTTEPAVMQAAFDRGVNYLDTARGYQGGENEKIVGKALKGYRDKVYVATKFLFGSKDAMMRSIEESLKCLDVDHVDVLMLHHPSRRQLFHEEAMEVLTQARQQGKARFLGLSTHNEEAETINAVAQDEDKFYDAVVTVYNFKSDPSLKEAIARAAKAGVGIIAMKTQAGGYETKELGDISPHQAALKWVLQDLNVAAAIPSMVDLDQIKENTQVMHMDLKLSQVDRRILERYGQAIAPYYCHRCGGCAATCPQGVDIPTVNRCLMYAEGYRDLDLARTTYAELPRTVSAAACANCSTCVAQCARGITIAQQMRRAQALFA